MNTCDCPVPADDACVKAYPAVIQPAARWVVGPIAAKTWAGAYVWAPTPGPNTRYFVTLHGTGEIAEKELYWWHNRLQRIRDCAETDLGIIAFQYHDPAAASDTGYLNFPEIHTLIDTVLTAEKNAGHAAGSGHIFHGFSRGSSNMYEFGVRDGQDGMRWGTRFIANAGAWTPTDPPPPAVAEAVTNNNTTALAGTKYYVAYGLQDHDPDQNGMIGQTNAAQVVKKLGGEAKIVEDATGCHSVLETGTMFDRAFPALLWALDRTW